MYNFFTSISKCLKNIYKWKYLFVEKLPQTLPVQGRPLKAHQTLPPWSRSTADPCSPSRRRNRKHDVNSYFVAKRSFDLDFDLPKHWWRWRQAFVQLPAKDLFPNIRWRPSIEPSSVGDCHIRCPLDSNHACDLYHKWNNVNRRTEAAFRSTAASTSGSTSRTPCFRVLERILFWAFRWSRHRLHRSISRREFPRSVDQR